MSIDALDNEFSAPELSELIHECPIHRWIGCAYSLHVDALEHRARTDWAGRLAGPRVTGRALVEILWPSASVGFAVATGGVVHCQQHNRRAGGFNAPQQLFTSFPLAWRIELVPDRPAESFVDILERSRCHRGEALECSRGPWRACDRRLAVGEEGAFAAGGAEENRAVVHRAEQFHTCIHECGIMQPTGTQLHALENLAVRAERRVIVDAA